MKAYMICSVSDTDRNKFGDYVKQLETAGWDVYWPPRDTQQEDSTCGFRICQDNVWAIEQADVMFLRRDECYLRECLFDLGVAFSLQKALVVMDSLPQVFALRYITQSGIIYSRMLREWILGRQMPSLCCNRCSSSIGWSDIVEAERHPCGNKHLVVET